MGGTPWVGGWTVEHRSGSAGELHGLDLPDPVERTVWVFEIERPAIVLGSGQLTPIVNDEAAGDAGVEVVRRRSGGGAVHLVPGRQAWIDLLIPADDPLWDDDVGRAMHWVGRCWAQALGSLGRDGKVHRGAMVSTPASSVVCFAGLGPGEVTVGGRKVVGVSQRRTRRGARFQTTALMGWKPGELEPFLTSEALEGANRINLEGVAAGLGGPAGRFEAALLAQLT
ncbi:MAG: hypothetical protein GY929_09310 [Actinomycetia bacterium]|nr:hypothetical protein [Actinomycetes bacterium]